MQNEERQITFNDIPEVLSEILKRFDLLDQSMELIREEVRRTKRPSLSDHIPMDVKEACEFLKIKKSTMYTYIQNGEYTMVFRFKDGRIRVDAPVVEDNLTDSDGWLNKTLSFTSYCHSHIAKNGKPATKFDVKKVSQTENAMNVIINQILGLIKTTPTITTDDNW